MYFVTQLTHVRLPGGRSVVLSPGPRGTRLNAITEEREDLDAGLRKAVPEDVLAGLIASGVIEERSDGS